MNTALLQEVTTNSSPNRPAMAPASDDMPAVSENGTFDEVLSDFVQPETSGAAVETPDPAGGASRPDDRRPDAGPDAALEDPAAADCEGAQTAPSKEKGGAPTEASATGERAADEKGPDEASPRDGGKANATAGPESAQADRDVQPAPAGQKALAIVAAAAGGETEAAPAREKDKAVAAPLADGKVVSGVTGKAGAKSLPADVIPARQSPTKGQTRSPETVKTPKAVRSSANNESDAKGETARLDETPSASSRGEPVAAEEPPRVRPRPAQKTHTAATAGTVSGIRKAAPEAAPAGARQAVMPQATPVGVAPAAKSAKAVKSVKSAAGKDSSGGVRNVREAAPQPATATRENDAEAQDAADADGRSDRADGPRGGDLAGKVTRIGQATTASRAGARTGGRVSGRPRATFATTFASQVQGATAPEAAPRTGGNAAASQVGTRTVIAQIEQVAFVQRAVEQARLVSQGRGVQELRVELRPPELGSVRLILSLENDQLQARVQVESNAAQEALERLAPRLRETLAGEGLELEKFEVNLRNSGHQQDRPDAHETRGGGARGLGRAFAETDEPEPAGTRPWRRPVPAGRMDYTA